MFIVVLTSECSNSSCMVLGAVPLGKRLFVKMRQNRDGLPSATKICNVNFQDGTAKAPQTY